MAFESLTDKLQNVFKNLRSKGRLTEEDVKTALKEVKMALHFKLCRTTNRGVCEPIFSGGKRPAVYVGGIAGVSSMGQNRYVILPFSSEAPLCGAILCRGREGRIPPEIYDMDDRRNRDSHRFNYCDSFLIYGMGCPE